MNKQPTPPINTRASMQNKYDVARANLLAVLGFSLVNVIISAVGADMYFLFSAWIPLLVTTFGKLLMAQTQEVLLLVLCVAVSVILILPYFFCWLFSKKQIGWMVGALVYFAMDCVLLLVISVSSGEIVSALVDILFHAWVMYYLIIGVRSGFALKKLPEAPIPEAITPSVDPEAATVETTPSTVPSTEPSPDDSPILRAAGNEEKVKVYVETQWSGHSIVYRKYGKNTEELVVDGNVYAEFAFKGLAKPHTMTATVCGMRISAGYFQSNFIMVNDQTVAQSVRWI